MKKLFLTMLAAVMLLASCSKEETPGQPNGEESIVTFSLSTSDLQTKAGEGTKAKTLYYAVYHETQEGEVIVDNVSEKSGIEKFAKGLSDNVEIPLLNGEKYSIIFWADAGGQDTACEIDWTNKTMTYSPKNANQETYDAFYAYVAPFTVTGPNTESVKMYRPFAQLNIGTTDGDLAELEEYNGLASVTYKCSKMEISTVYNTLNLANGEVSASGSGESSYSYTDFSGLSAESFSVSGYEYLSMNYVLVGAEKSLTNVTMTIATDINGANAVARTFDNVPVQRNYRTNIYGDLYASTMTYDVLIEPAWKTGDFYVMSGIVTLSENLNIDKPILVNSNTTLDLAGFNITNTSTYAVDGNGDPIVGEATDCHAIVVRDGTLNIKGDGTVSAMAGSMYDMAIWALGGTTNIYGGKYTNKGIADNGSDVIYAKNDAVVNIYGGVFEAGNVNKESFADKTNGVYAALNLNGSATGSINVYGGTFINFDPANPGTEFDTWKESHPNGFVADGYMSLVISDGVFVIVKDGSTTDEITMASDMNLFSSLKVKSLDGGNNTLKSTAQRGVVSNGGSIKNVTLNGGADYAKDKDGNYVLNASGKKLSTRVIWLENVTEDVIIENVTVRDAGYAFNTGSGIGDNLKLTVSNSTFENWMSYDGFASASFSNCNFEVGSYFEQGSEFNGGMRPYVETLFENCNFESGFKVDSYCVVNEGKSNERVVNPKLTFKNCKINGELLTSSNISNLLFAEEEGTSNSVIVQ